MTTGGRFFLVSVLTLASTSLPGQATGRAMIVRTCHGGIVSVPLAPQPGRRDPESCPAGCHAACLRKAFDDDGEEGE